MSRFVKLNTDSWGHESSWSGSPEDIVERLSLEIREGIAQYKIVSINKETAEQNPGYYRIYANLTISLELFDALMNGASGYRAQYYQGLKTGESYNKFLVDQIKHIFLENDQLFTDDITADFCEASIEGEFTKIWFSKQITSPEYDNTLKQTPETIRAERWVNHWSHKPPPRKGLVAPVPEEPVILLNGSFVNGAVNSIWDQKPNRSNDIYLTGWT